VARQIRDLKTRREIPCSAPLIGVTVETKTPREWFFRVAFPRGRKPAATGSCHDCSIRTEAFG
jgi:hypothetical protein